MAVAIRIERLSVDFSGKAVLRDVSLEIPKGGPTFLLGRSGSGKTTLLRAINRLNECFPACRTSGRVVVNTADGAMDAYAPDTAVEVLRRRVGMVFQTPNVLPLSIARNICMPLEATQGMRGAEAEARMEEALREAHLWSEVRDRLRDPAVALSGGQQQRLCLARALALRPDILLLDEPTASLDFKAAQMVEELLGELKSRYTLVVVSHGLSQARRLAEYLFVLHDQGRVEELGKDVFRDKDALLAVLGDLL
jgi:phosphate transport system ATP-binding protein